MANGFAFEAWDGEVPSGHAPPMAELSAGERIGPPRPSRTLVALKRLTAISAVAVLAWTCWQTRETLNPWISSALEPIHANIPPPAPATPPSQEEPAAASTAVVQPLPARQDIKDVAGSAANPPGSASASLSEDALPPASTASSTTSDLISNAPQPLPPPVVDPQDKKQKRAAAIGLHPGISPVLLSSMSDTDYRNAAHAIRKALAETTDADKFVWPLKRNPRLAVFQIHFVQGAGPDCRRYVLTVIKNGWTTTAPPMEKCGIEKPKQSPASSPGQKSNGLPRLGGVRPVNYPP